VTEQQPGRADEAAAFAPFRPRRGRVVAIVAAVVTLVLFALLAALLPGPREGGHWALGDKLFFAAVGVAMAAMLWRFAAIRALPTREALTIRNLFLTRTIEWSQVVDVRFEGGDPWLTLELTDTDTVAVMAIQKADGSFGRAEASRLAALVAAHAGAEPGSSS
jgi:MFS family permease